MDRRSAQRSKTLIPRVVLLAAWVILLTRPAAAYIDPGSGSFLLQVVIAGLISAAVAIKMFWRNIKRAIFRRSPESSDADDDDR